VQSNLSRLLTLLLLLVPLALCGPVAAAEMTSCTMTFDLGGWSAFYKRARGKGVVTCDNGQKAKVKIEVTGGGLTLGRSRMRDATGTFSQVLDIEEIFGSYAAVGAGAGAVRSSEAMALTKGEVSLALAGTGQGFQLGVSGARFTIRRR
jgi:hypothetical protein